MRRAVFLDRDGTILDELGYLTPDSTIHVYPFSIDAIRLFSRAGFAVVVISALLSGLDVQAAVKRVAWIGARAVQVLGDTEGLPTKDDLAQAKL